METRLICSSLLSLYSFSIKHWNHFKICDKRVISFTLVTWNHIYTRQSELLRVLVILCVNVVQLLGSYSLNGRGISLKKICTVWRKSE